MHFTNTLLSLSALLSLAATHPVESVSATQAGSLTTTSPAAPSKTLIDVDLDADLALIELGLELEIVKSHGLLEIDLEIEIGPIEIDIELDIALPTKPPPTDLSAYNVLMDEIKCSLPHTRLSPEAGEVFRSHFALLNEHTYSIPAFRHITWKIGKDRFKVENWSGKDLVGLKFADNEFTAQQMGLVCPDNCKGKGCKATEKVDGIKLKNRIYTV